MTALNASLLSFDDVRQAKLPVLCGLAILPAWYIADILTKSFLIESNPIPVKAALAMMGLIEEEYRLPLCPLAAKNREILAATMKGCGLI